jgi:hypothetical protein
MYKENKYIHDKNISYSLDVVVARLWAGDAFWFFLFVAAPV